VSAADDLNEYLDAVIGDTEGYLHTAVGIGGFFSDTGRYSHKRWVERHYRWPAQRSQAVADLLASAEESDAYVCPYLMVADKRAKGAAAARKFVKGDVDGGRYDPGKAEQLDAEVVASGSDGNAHVYVMLAESIPFNWHEVLSRGLAAYLGADSKISDNDVLRAPGTWNHKARVRQAGGEPTPVRWVRRSSGTRWEPNALAEFLGVTLPATAAPPAKRKPGGPVIVEPVDLTGLPKRVADALAKNTGDRSEDTMRVVGACHDAGCTLAQTRAVVASRADLAERLAERDDDDVETCWPKAVDSRQARAAAVPEVPAAELAPAGQPEADTADAEPEATTWEPVDLGPWLSGEHVSPQPTVGIARSDGRKLLYPGREHTVFGETEAGKSWFALECCASEIRMDRDVVYIHYEEGDPGSTIERLRLLDVTPEQIAQHLRFVAPARPVRGDWLTPLLGPAARPGDPRRRE